MAKSPKLPRMYGEIRKFEASVLLLLMLELAGDEPLKAEMLCCVMTPLASMNSQLSMASSEPKAFRAFCVLLRDESCA